MSTTSPIAIMDWRSKLAQGNTSAVTRGVGADETVEHRLNNLTASDSRYIQQARSSAQRAASAPTAAGWALSLGLGKRRGTYRRAWFG